MKKAYLKQAYFYLFLFILIAIVFHKPTVAWAYSGNGDLIVHVTYTGKCYHRGGCGALRSDIEMPLEETYLAGYLRCDRCNPPAYTGNATRTSKKAKESAVYAGGSNRSISETPREAPQSSKKSGSLLPILFGIGGLASVWVAYHAIKDSNERKKELLRQQQEYEARKQYYEENYKGRRIEEIVGAPEGVVIERDGKVIKGISTSERPYGELTVFISYSGSKYHQNPNCRGTCNMIPVNKYAAISHGYTVCSLCGKEQEFMVPDWYTKIPQVKSYKEEFE